MVEDIPICQAAGKTVLLSLGGASPNTQKILSEQSAIDFADFLWGAFGPVTEKWTAANGPRPFRDVVVDGFDFDIEHNGGYGMFCLLVFVWIANILTVILQATPSWPTVSVPTSPKFLTENSISPPPPNV